MNINRTIAYDTLVNSSEPAAVVAVQGLDAAGKPVLDRDIAPTVAALKAGQAAGVPDYRTLAELNADLSRPDKSTVTVSEDPTPANNGTWRKAGAPGTGSYTKISGDTVATLSGKSAQLANLVGAKSVYYGFGPALLDWVGTLGQARTAYYAVGFRCEMPGKGAATLATLAPASARLPGYYELQFGTDGIYAVYANRVTGIPTAYASGALPAFSDNLVYLHTVRGSTGQVINADYPLTPLQGGKGQFHIYNSIVIEKDASGNDIVLIPRAVWNSGAFAAQRPVPATLFEKELSGFTPSATAQSLVFDQALQRTGADPYRVVAHPVWLDSVATFTILSKASVTSPYACHTGHALIGAVANGSARNELTLGRNAVEQARLLYRNTKPCDITNAALVALGFTRGMNDPTTYTPFYGEPFKDATPGTYVGWRFGVQTDQDNNFPVMRGYLVRDSDGLNVLPFNISIERQIDARAAFYTAWYKIPDDGVVYRGAFFGTISANGRDIRVCALQQASGQIAPTWIMRADFPVVSVAAGSGLTAVQAALIGQPVTGKIVCAERLYTVEGEPFTLYGDHLLETRTDGQDVILSIEPMAIPAGKTRLGAWKTAKRELSLVGGQLAPNSRLMVRRASDNPSKRNVRAITVHTALKAAIAGLSNKNIVLLVVGDSLTEFCGYVHAMVRGLVALGFTVKLIGSVQIREADLITGAENLVYGEGRGSRDWGNYSYSLGTGGAVPCEPFADSFLPTYWAMSTTDKKAYNPFLRPAVAGDPAQRVFNGQIADFAFYRDRFNTFFANRSPVLPQWDVPTHILFNLGTNDATHNNSGGVITAPGISSINTGMETMCGQARTAFPNAQIGLLTNPLGRGVEGDGRWSMQVQLNRLMQAFVSAQPAANKVALINAMAMATSEMGYALATDGNIDAVTGNQPSINSDPIHYRGPPKEEVGMAAMAWAACTMTGAA